MKWQRHINYSETTIFYETIRVYDFERFGYSVKCPSHLTGVDYIQLKANTRDEAEKEAIPVLIKKIQERLALMNEFVVALQETL